MVTKSPVCHRRCRPRHRNMRWCTTRRKVVCLRLSVPFVRPFCPCKKYIYICIIKVSVYGSALCEMLRDSTRKIFNFEPATTESDGSNGIGYSAVGVINTFESLWTLSQSKQSTRQRTNTPINSNMHYKSVYIIQQKNRHASRI